MTPINIFSIFLYKLKVNILNIMSKNKKKKISQKELERRKKQAKMWHIATHPNEEYENAEKKRRDNYYNSNNNSFEPIPLN